MKPVKPSANPTVAASALKQVKTVKSGKKAKESTPTARLETKKTGGQGLGIGGKHAGGRPTDYKPEYVELVYKLALLGAHDKEMAAIIGVTEQTLNNWKQTYPKFFESMSNGKEKADAVIAEALYHRAKGYSHAETHVSNYQGEITLTPLTKHYPPDTAAASLWLRNRDPSRWRDKIDHELAGRNGGPIEITVMDQIAASAGNRIKLSGGVSQSDTADVKGAKNAALTPKARADGIGL